MKRLLFCVILSLNAYVHADVYGSDVAVSALPAFTAPAAPVVPNRIAYFGWTQNGFTLTDATTSLLFDSVFPVSGSVQMNGGTITLNRDLIMNNVATLQGLGSILATGHVLSLAQSIVSLPLDTQRFDNARIAMNSDVTLRSAITFSSTGTGFCSIQGNGHVLTLAPGSSMSITGTLQLHNIIIDGISGTNIQCANNNSVLELDNVTWIQTNTFTFGTGVFICQNNVILRGNQTAFVYQTNQSSIIQSDATLFLDTGLTFSYDQANNNHPSNLTFVDGSSLLVLNGASLLTTTTPLNLTAGSLLVKGDSFISTSTISAPIIFGDGVSAAHDMAITIAACGKVTMAQGALYYQNISSSSWMMENSLSHLEMGSGTLLRLYKSMNLGNGVVIFDDATIMQRKINTFLLGSVQTLGTTFFEII